MTDEMKKIVRGGMLCLIIAISFVACSEAIVDPKTPGSGLTSRDVIIRDTVFYADTTYESNFLTRLPTDPVYDANGTYVLLDQNSVGRAGNTYARSLIRFYTPIRETINVKRATLTLKFLSWRGDSSGQFQIGFHKVNIGWTSYNVLWDSTNSSNFFDAAPFQTYSSTVGPDTQTITIDLDTAMVRSWYRSDYTHGILINPIASSRLMRGFASFEHDSTAYRPILHVIAEGTSATHPLDTSDISTGFDCFVADVSPITLLNDHLYSQAGVVYRSSLKFDVSSLPRGAVVNTAELQLVSDPSITKYSKFTASPAPAVHARTSSSDSTKYQSVGSTGSVSSNTYSFDVRLQMQQWVAGYNYGLLLRQPSYNEFSTLDLYSFYGSKTANASLRPRIKVKYAIFQ